MSRPFYGWRIVAVCLIAGAFANAFGLFGAGVYLHELVATRGWPTGLVSGAITTFYVTSAVLLIPVGSLIGRHGGRPSIMIGALAMCAGIAAMVSVGKYGSAATNTGETYELMVIAAAVVGGASLTGGRGTAIGAILGALIIQLIDNGLFIIKKVNLGFTVLEISKQYSKIIVGIAIIIAVAIDRLGQQLQERRLKKH